jgi:late competence protein required for DNA uptake (superfamily II DNA/RNA helicase)
MDKRNNAATEPSTFGLASKCSACGNEIHENACYAHRGKIYCEACILDKRMVRQRKTHWQYLSSIKSDYLKPARQDRCSESGNRTNKADRKFDSL